MERQPMSIARACFAALLGAASLLAACDSKTTSRDKPEMTTSNQRLQPLFEKTKTVCFGRFLIDLPARAEGVWGQSLTPFSIDAFVGEAAAIDEQVARRENELKAETRIPTSKNLPMYFETLSGAKRGQRTIVSQRSADTPGDFRLESFFAIDQDLYLITAFAD